MTLPTFAAKRDANEPEVAGAFLLDGFGVVYNSARGVFDLFVWDKRSHWPPPWAYVEVKSKRGKLTPDQEKWAKDHPDLPKYIARSEADARAISRELRSKGGGSWGALEEQEHAQAERVRRVKGDQPA